MADHAGGLAWGFFFAPADWQQGDTSRIMYIHVPSAWLASAGYFSLAICSALSLVWRHPLADVAAAEISPVGAGFTALCLATGSLWGKPTWGAWWVWDARLTSVLVLFFLYLGHIALVRAFDDPTRGTGWRHPGAGRRDQPADHQVQRRLVEHTALNGETIFVPEAARWHRSTVADQPPRPSAISQHSNETPQASRTRRSGRLRATAMPQAPLRYQEGDIQEREPDEAPA